MKNLNRIKIDKKWYRNIFIYFIGYAIVKNFRYVKISCVNPLYLNFIPLYLYTFILELRSMIIVVRSVFHEGDKYLQQCFIDQCLHKLLMLEYDRIEVSKGINVNKTDGSRECIICHYWYLLNMNSRFQPKICNGRHDLMETARIFIDVVIFFC